MPTVKRVGSPVFVRGRPFYTNDIVDIPEDWIEGKGWERLDAAPARLTEPMPRAPADPNPARAEPDETWTRAALDAHASALGIDPSRARTKADVLALIKAG